MKKISLCLMAVFLSLTFVPQQSKAEKAPVSTSATKPSESAEANALIARLDEINAMDKSKLNSSEKKQLRKEVRGIKSHLQQMSGVYISVGAIILIVILLIILL